MKQTKRAGAAIAILLLMAARAQAQTISGTADIDTVSNEIRVKIDPGTPDTLIPGSWDIMLTIYCRRAIATTTPILGVSEIIVNPGMITINSWYGMRTFALTDSAGIVHTRGQADLVLYP